MSSSSIVSNGNRIGNPPSQVLGTYNTSDGGVEYNLNLEATNLTQNTIDFVGSSSVIQFGYTKDIDFIPTSAGALQYRPLMRNPNYHLGSVPSGAAAYTLPFLTAGTDTEFSLDRIFYPPFDSAVAQLQFHFAAALFGGDSGMAGDITIEDITVELRSFQSANQHSPFSPLDTFNIPLQAAFTPLAANTGGFQIFVVDYTYTLPFQVFQGQPFTAQIIIDTQTTGDYDASYQAGILPLFSYYPPDGDAFKLYESQIKAVFQPLQSSRNNVIPFASAQKVSGVNTD